MEERGLTDRTRINWYMATVQAQLVYYTSDERLADKLTNGAYEHCASLYQNSISSQKHSSSSSPLAESSVSWLGSIRITQLIRGIPGIGWLLDNRPMNNIVLVMGIMGLAFGVLTILPYIATQLIGIAILTVFRPLFYTAISWVLSIE